MEHPTLEYIRGLRRQLETKKAEITGENPPSTIPGSEHDSKIPAAAKAPDKETKDQTMVPNSGLTTAGAGDDSKITHQNDLTAEQAALSPTKKPEVTGDAEAQVPGGKTAEAKSLTEKTAEQLGAEILAGVTAWEQKQAEAAKASSVQGNSNKKAEEAQKAVTDAEALITDKGTEPDQLKDVKAPTKKDEVTPNAMAPATGEGASGETAAAAKAAEDAQKAAAEDKEAQCCKDGKCGKCAKCKAAAKPAAEDKEAQCCKDGKCGKCAKCKAAAKTAAEDAQKKAGALDMELTSAVLAKIAAVMLATEEGTKLAEATLAKAAGAEAAEKTLNFLRTQNDLAQKQAEYKAGQRAALLAILKKAQDEGAGDAGAAAADEGAAGADAGATGGSANEVAEIANTLDAMVEAGEITEDDADAVVVELAQALTGGAAPAAAAGEQGCDAGASCGDAGAAKTEGGEEQKKEAQDAGAAAAGDAAINAQVAVPPEQLDAGSVPQGGVDGITPEQVAGAIDQLVESGEISEEEADQLVQEITGDTGGAAAGSEEEISPEEIATVLQEAVESGEIKPEDVQQVLTELEGVPAPADAGAAGGDAGAAAAAAGGTAPDASTVAPADEPKTAGAKLIAAINAARAQKKAAAQQAAAR